jgi:hypothetical protein
MMKNKDGELNPEEWGWSVITSEDSHLSGAGGMSKFLQLQNWIQHNEM